MTEKEILEGNKKALRQEANACFGTIEILMQEINERKQMIKRMESKAALYNKQAQDIADTLLEIEYSELKSLNL